MKGRKASDDQEYSSRAQEIRAWLQEYFQLEMGIHNSANSGGGHYDKISEEHGIRFVILDDRPTAADDSEFLQKRFIHCDTTQGITEEEVDRAIRILLHDDGS
ncbi:unnamed protein product [Cylindrotheca closterium]|nr:unnamed protein product [Cylindrotheca closterium]